MRQRKLRAWKKNGKCDINNSNVACWTENEKLGTSCVPPACLYAQLDLSSEKGQVGKTRRGESSIVPVSFDGFFSANCGVEGDFF